MDGFGKPHFLGDDEVGKAAPSYPNLDTVDENGMPLFEQVVYGHPGGTSSGVLSHLGNTNSPRGSDLTQNNLPRTGTGNPRMTTERAARKRLIDKAYRERLKQDKIQMESTLRQLSGENETLKKENERLQYENDSLNKTLQTERILVNQLKNDYDKQYVLVQILSERMACPDLQLENGRLKLENDQLRSAANLDYYILLAKENGELKLENKVLRVQNDALCGKLINDSNKKPA